MSALLTRSGNRRTMSVNSLSGRCLFNGKRNCRRWRPRNWLVAKRPRRKGIPDPSLLDDTVDWVATIRAANGDFAVAALATLLEQAGLLGRAPTDVQRFLRYAVSQNTEANRRIREQCVEIGDALSRVGLHCVLLKGAAWLFEDGPATQDRMLRDIDLLVPGPVYEAARTALLALDYKPSSTIMHETGHVHEVPLEHPDRLVSVELHVELTTRMRYLSADEVLAQASPSRPASLCPRHYIASCIMSCMARSSMATSSPER